MNRHPRNSLPDLADRVAALEARDRDRISEESRFRDERRHEFNGLVEGARRTLEQALAAGLQPLRDIHAMNEEQMELLKDARDERVIRKAKERIAEDEAKTAEAKREQFRKTVILVTALFTAVGSFLGALAALHH